MFGVVLWSDADDRKAVIWCEDHGDLAFYKVSEAERNGVSLDAGDLVQFDMTTDRDLRLAHNPVLVREHAYEGIGERLESEARRQDRKSAEIVPLMGYTAGHKRASVGEHAALAR